MNVRRIFNVILIAAAALLGILAAAVLVLLFRPDWVVNTRTLHWAAERVASPELRPLLQKIHIEVRSVAWARQKIHLQARALCHEHGLTGLSFCADTVEVEAHLNWKRWPPLESLDVVKIDRLRGQLTILHESSPSGPSVPPTAAILSLLEGIALPSWLSEVPLGLIHIDVQWWDFLNATGKARITGGLECRQSEHAALRCDLALQERSDSLPFEHQIEVTGWLRSIQGHRLRPEAATFSIRASAPRRGSLQTSVRLKRADRSRWNARLDAGLRVSGGPISRVTLTDCKIELGPRLGKLHCPLVVHPSPELEKKHSRSLRTGPVQVRVDFEGRLHDTIANHLTARTRVEFAPITKSSLRFEGWVANQFDGSIGQFMDPERQKLTCGLDIQRVDFRDVRTIFAMTGLIVPAPLDSLRGGMSVNVSCQPRHRASELSFVVRTSARLRSPNQILRFKQEGDLRIAYGIAGTSAHLEGDIRIQDSQLILPPIDLRALPDLLPLGPTIQSARDRARQLRDGAESSNFTYRFHVRTDQPLRLVTQMTPKPVPILVDLILASDSPLLGSVEIKNAELELFRRRGTIQSLRFQFDPKRDSPEIRGEVRVPQPDYTVHVLLSGTTEAPVVRMVSDPPLPPDEVVSVLLFGAPTREIGLDDQESAKSAQSLFVSRSITLLSLYVLASTPIQQVGFNPDSNNVSARVRVSNRTTLNVGASRGQESTEGSLRLRRRIGKSWSFVTGVETPGPQDESNVSAWLEWSKRY